MPDPNQTDPNQTSSVVTDPQTVGSPTVQEPTVPTISPQSDLPPLPPAFQNLPDDSAPVSTVDVPPADSGSAAPPPDISSIIDKPKKKFGSGKIIATILGLFVLVGGVGAGILLTQQKQLIQQKASCVEGATDCQKTSSSQTSCYTFTCTGGTWVDIHENCTCPGDGGGGPICTNPGGAVCNGGVCDGCYNQYPGYTYCSLGIQRTCTRTESFGLCTNTDVGPCDNPCLPRPSEPNYVPPVECGGGQPPASPPGRPDYCVSATINKAEINPGEEAAVSSTTNTDVNGFFYAAYNMDNLYGPGNAKPICTGSGSDPQCPSGGTPLIFSDQNNKTDGSGLRKSGSANVSYANLFVTDKNWNNQQVKNVSFTAYFSLNGGEWSVPNPNCVTYTKAATATLGGACRSLTAKSLTDGHTFTQAELNTMKAGDDINLCVEGTPGSYVGFYTGVIITINGVDNWEPLGVTNPNGTCITYTIPAGTTTFNMSARMEMAPPR